MKIIPLSEGSFTIDKTKLFVPFNTEQDDLQQRATGSLLVEVQPFAVITSKDILVIDTGLGFNKDGKPQIHSNLEANGINPGQVTKVLVSHLHKDHAGGLGQKNVQGQYQPVFTNALYYIQSKEFEYAMQKGFPSYITEEIAFLKNSSRVQWLDGNGLIDGYISYQITAAHSPFHQVFLVEENNECIFFGGDDAPQLQQMKHKFIAKYDFDGRKCMELRKQWWQEGREKGWSFLFYHDIKTPVFKQV